VSESDPPSLAIHGDSVVCLRVCGGIVSIVDGEMDSLPPCSPELNRGEHIWDAIREKCFAKRVFESLDALETHLSTALSEMESDHQCARSIAAWRWILKMPS
jgi:hypothetical protein